jgi:hypothetical protein
MGLNNFNDAAVNAVFDRIVSYSLASGRFDHVNQHEPKNAPGGGLSASIWIQAIRPLGKTSGLSATSGLLLLNHRIYTSFRSQPYDMIDPSVTAATCDLMGALSGDFELGGIAGVRAVDLLGMSGTALNATSGYVEIDRNIYRVMTTIIPIIINDMFSMAA